MMPPLDERLELRVSERWLLDVDASREGLRVSRSEFIRGAVESVARQEVVPTAMLSEAIGRIEAAQGRLSDRVAIGRLDDAITCLMAVEDMELPGSVA